LLIEADTSTSCQSIKSTRLQADSPDCRDSLPATFQAEALTFFDFPQIFNVQEKYAVKNKLQSAHALIGFIFPRRKELYQKWEVDEFSCVCQRE
jgi:hypothetical protein